MNAAGSNNDTNLNTNRDDEELRKSIDKDLPSVPSSDEDLNYKPENEDDSDDDKPLRPTDGPSTTTLKELDWLLEEDPLNKVRIEKKEKKSEI